MNKVLFSYIEIIEKFDTIFPNKVFDNIFIVLEMR